MNTSHRTLSTFAVTLMLAGALSACGGGGSSLSDNEVGLGADGGTTAAARVGTFSGATAAGLYSGIASSGLRFTAAILPTGESWSVYDRNGVPYGLIRADNGWNGSQLVGTGDDYLVVAGTKAASVFDSTYRSKTSITAMLQSSASETMQLLYDPGSDKPAAQADLVGTFKLESLSAQGYSAGSVTTPDASGAFTGWVAKCLFSGRSVARTDAGGVFDTTVTFASEGCTFNGRTLSGVSVLADRNGVPTLTIAALLPDRSAGFAAIGVR